MTEFLRKIRALARSHKAARELDEEMRHHLAMSAQAQVESGATPEDAGANARRRFGNVLLLREESRDAWTWRSLEASWKDLRYAARMLRKNPGFTSVAVVSLAIGIGANTAIFSVVNAFLLRPLPFRDSASLVRLWPTNTKTGLLPYSITSYPNFTDWQAASRTLQRIEAYVPRSFNITGGEQPEHVTALRTSGGLLQLLEVNPILGRTFSAEEIQPGRDHVVLLTESLWQSRFARDPAILGKLVKLNDESFTIVGILPASFQFPPDHPAAIVLPQPADPDRGHGFVNVVARLRSGATLRQAQAEMDTIARQQEIAYPKQNKDAGVRVLSLRDSYSVTVRPALLIFLSAVAFVLLIACANVANLFLARTAARQKELVVRRALGAGRGRLVRQLLTESALLGLTGGAVALLFAYWGTKGLVVLVRATFATQAFDNVSIDATVLTFALAISLAAGLLSGLAPALGASRLNVNDTLKEGSRGLTQNRRHNRIRGALVVAEIALALVLLTGTGLMIRSLVLLNRVDPGFRPENVLVLNFQIGAKKYARTEARAPFVATVLHRVEQLPGVESGAVVTDPPLSPDNDALSISIEGRPDPAPDKRIPVSVNVVGPGYLRTLGIPLLKGRDFTTADTQSTPLVALINQAMARKYWPGQDPIGARISGNGKNWATIQGIVGDVRQAGLSAEPKPEFYLSYLQDPFAWPYLTMLVRTTFDPSKLAASIQAAIWSVEKDLPIASVSTMEQLRSRSIAQPRLTALLFTVFASFALVLATAGIYGVMAYSVMQRTHEMGLRMALGARAPDVLRQVVGHGMLLAAMGVAVGLAGAFALTRLLAKFLYGVRPTDAATFAGVVLLLAAVALLASYIPARRATKVDPMIALRYE